MHVEYFPVHNAAVASIAIPELISILSHARGGEQIQYPAAVVSFLNLPNQIISPRVLVHSHTMQRSARNSLRFAATAQLHM